MARLLKVKALMARFCRPAACVLLASTLAGCVGPSPDYADQRLFTSPEEAVRTLQDAATRGDAVTLSSIFGPEGEKILSSGDPIADRAGREVVAVAMQQSWQLDPIDSNTQELVIGHEQWPFPILLERDSRGWWFNTVEGREEVLARRIGRNELASIGALRAYVMAQREFASESRDGQPAGAYATKLRSDPGRRNGLYWPQSSPSDPPSPLGPFADAAIKEGYGTSNREGEAPYYGYYFRILTRQGAAAPGGAKDFFEGGVMRGGFAMIAHPAQHGTSGIMTFIVGPDGVIFERDLGPQTASSVALIQEFNPDADWRPLD